ncbi:MAG: hypothetical protein EZS28_018278, partial [Streblomastix strix]
ENNQFYYSTANEQGGAIQLSSSVDSIQTIKGVLIENCESQNVGGGIMVDLFDSSPYFGALAEIINTTIINCKTSYFSYGLGGGGIYASINGQGTILIEDSIISNCNSSQAANGWGINIRRYSNNTKLFISNTSFINCKTIPSDSDPKYGWGGAIFFDTSLTTSKLNSQNFLLTDLVFNGCESVAQAGHNLHIVSLNIQAAGLFIKNGNLLTVNNTVNLYENELYANDYMGLDSSKVNGGYVQLSDHTPLFTQFVAQPFINPYYIDPESGAIYSTLSGGVLIIEDSTFDTCNCTQPGSGGALAIIQDSTSKLTDLTFSGCEAVNQRGNNIHIVSPDTHLTGLTIAVLGLLTVNGTNDLYTSQIYQNDYMGINQSLQNNGQNLPDNHEPLFIEVYSQNFEAQYYIDSQSGSDTNNCLSTQTSCVTFNHTLSLTLPPEFVQDLCIVVINLLTGTSDQSLIQFATSPILNHIITIQSNEYDPEGGYTKRSINTNQQTSGLFSLLNFARLELLGIRFDNLNPTASAPLINIQTSSKELITSLSIIDCEFSQDSTSFPNQYIYHPIISINGGGSLIIRNTLIENYQFTDGKSFMMIQSQEMYPSEGYFSNQIKIINTSFKNIKQEDGAGAAINAQLNHGNNLKIYEQSSFTNCISSYYGGAISIEIYSEQQLELNEITITNCSGPIGGGIYCLVNDKGKLIISSTQFKNCTCIDGQGGGIFVRLNGINSKCLLSETVMENCTSSIGGGIHARLNNGELKLNGVNMTNCTSSQGGGLYLFIQSANCLCTISETLIQKCNSTEGGAIFAQITEGNLEMSKLAIQDCYSQIGGGIYSSVDQSGKLIIKDSCSFTNCQSQSGSGGAIYSSLSGGVLIIDGTTFDTCSATQPGNGGALSLYQQTATSVIKINNVAFTNCKTLLNSTNSTYGWGGGIFLFIAISSNVLSSSNLLMIDLYFSGCQSSIAGHNIHIRSPNTKATGLTISQNSLLSVNGIYDLYTSPDYEFDYMGIDESKVNDGNNTLYNHLPLFTSNIPIEAAKDYYINTDSGDNSGSCEDDQSSCQSITYILDFDGSLISGYNKGTEFIAINILVSTSQEEQILISSNTPLGNLIIIQSDGYQPNMNSYPKQSFLTSSQYNTIFTITDTGHLELYGLHFDNLISTTSAINPLISISSNNNNDNTTLQIIDCEFKQNLTSKPIQYLSHSIIDINGGYLVIKRTKLQNYIISNVKSLIMIRSVEIKVHSNAFIENNIQISNSQFENIQQIGFANGAVINAQLKQGSKLQISQSSEFINCICGTIQGYRNIQLSGGAIYAVINGGQMQLSGIIMDKCKSESGGAVFANISNQGNLILDSQCQFYQCESYGNGGGIYVQMDFTTQSQFVINGAIFKQCRSFSSKTSSNLKSGYGGGIFLTGTGDYNPSSELLDLRGMKIYQNSALNNGQSMFVVMANVVEWCQQGILGEYVKGNYSDLNSDVNELEGIAVSAETFESLTIEQINIQQQKLEFHWTQQAIINSVQIIVNVSKEQNPLQFTIQGDLMKLPRDKDGFIIWPPKNATSLPIVLDISSNSSQSVQFALKDFSWVDNRMKIYGMLVSNTGKFFTGLDGLENEAVQIEIQIEEGEQFYNFKTSYGQDSKSKFVFTWWIILIIASAGLILLIIIIIICCCICNRSKKKKEHIIYPVQEENEIRPH